MADDPAGRVPGAPHPLLTGGRAALLIGLASFVVYAGSLRTIQTLDATTNVLLAYSLVRDRDIALDENGPYRDRLSYWSFPVGGREVSPYPPGAALVGVPFALLGTAVGVAPPDPLSVAVFGKLAASAATAASVAFVYAAARGLAGARAAAAVAALYAFGGATWPISAGALWQHGPAQLGIAAGLWAALRGDALRSGLAFAFATLARLTDGAFLAAAALTSARRLPVFALGALAPLLVLAAYLTLAFGSPFDTRYAAFNLTGPRDPLGAFVGLFISPGRGLFVHSPWAAFAVAGLWRAPALLRAQALAALALLGTFAFSVDWWGGHGYGTRYLADALPVLALGVAVWLARGPGRSARVLLAAAGVWSFALALVGALFYDWQAWSLERAHPGAEIAWRIDPTPWWYAASRATQDPLTAVALAAVALGAGGFALVLATTARDG